MVQWLLWVSLPVPPLRKSPPETHPCPAGPRSDLQHLSRNRRDPGAELTRSLPDPTELQPGPRCEPPRSSELLVQPLWAAWRPPMVGWEPVCGSNAAEREEALGWGTESGRHLTPPP